MMERRPKTVPRTPPAVTSPSTCNKEGDGCAGNQPSPIPGETASPASLFQHSPSLPASGLTELSGGEPRAWDALAKGPQDLPAARRDLASTVNAPQRQYMGVRVRMPVRELLKKIRLSKETDSSSYKETPAKAGSKMTSGITEKKRACSERWNKQKRKHTQAALKSVEDLDILVEVLEEDLNMSHAKPGFWQNQPLRQELFTQFWPPWPEADGRSQPGSSREATGFQPYGPFPRSGPLVPLHAENLDGCHHREEHLDPSNAHQSLCKEGGPQRGLGVAVESAAALPGFARETVQPRSHSAPGHMGPDPLEDGVAAMAGSPQPKPSARPSFFQFQLCCEESWLKTISVERLIAPDKNGNRLLHEAVIQGKRALAYALAWRFASLDRIDEKGAAKQTALHLASERNHSLIVSDLISLGADVNARDSLEKTPLHLCAERGHLKVLQVLKNCQEGGIHVEVDVTDNQGFTPFQCAALAYCTLSKDLKKEILSPEARRVRTLQKEQIWGSMNGLVQMGADPWGQGAKSSSQALNCLANIQEDDEWMSLFQTHQLKQQKDSSSLPGPEEMALLYLQGEDVNPPLSPSPGFLNHFPEVAV